MTNARVQNQAIIEDRSHDPFIILDCRLLKIPLTTEAFRIYAELKRFANSEGRCFPSYNRLAEVFKGSFPNSHEVTLRKKAIASVQELISWGLVRKEERYYNDTSANCSNLYILTPVSEWFAEASHASSLSHKKRPNQHLNKKGSVESTPPLNMQLGSVESTPLSVESTPPSVESTPRGVESSTLTRSKYLRSNELRSTYLDPVQEKTPLTPQGGNRTETADISKSDWWEEEKDQEAKSQHPATLDNKAGLSGLTSQLIHEDKGSGASFDFSEQSNNGSAIACEIAQTQSPARLEKTEPVQTKDLAKKRKGLTEEEQQWFLAAYHEERPSNFVAHEVLSDRAQSQILKLVKAHGNKSMQTLTEALIYVREQKDPWWRKSRFALENFLSNDKVTEYSTKHQDAMRHDAAYRDRVNGTAPSMDKGRQAALVVNQDGGMHSPTEDDEINELFYGKKKNVN